MKKTLIYAAGAMGFMLAACQPSPQQVKDDGLVYIDVAGAMENLSELKVSDLGSHVRYVPLETNDSCLITDAPKLMVLDKYVLVSSGEQVYCFDKETGRFLNSIGHVGEDPEGYSEARLPAYNERNGLLYFVRQPNQLQKYDLKGHYRGKAIVPTPPAMPGNYAFVDTLIVGCHDHSSQSRSLTFFTEAGCLTDTVLSILPDLPQLSLSGHFVFTPLQFGNIEMITLQGKDGMAALLSTQSFPLWKQNGRLRYKGLFNDTIYDVASSGRISPTFVFDLGKYCLKCQNSWKVSEIVNKLLPVYAVESPDKLYFLCIHELSEGVNGIYDKATGTIRMGWEEDGLKDDINGFLPFHPTTCNVQGEFASLIWPGDIQSWLGEHPEAKNNPALAPLLNLSEEDNPVVVLVK